MDTQIRLSIASGNAARVSQYAEATDKSTASDLLTRQESQTVTFQSDAALAVKRLYDTFALLSSRSVGELAEINIPDRSVRV